MNANFEAMVRRTGAYSLPWLIKLSDEANTAALYFINDTEGIVHGGNAYVATTLEYTPNADSQGFSGGGSLSIPVTDNAIIEMIETYYNVRLEVIGVRLDDGTVDEIKTFQHHYGAVKWNGKKAEFTFERDDRLDMTFPALIFSHYNCRGNA